MAITLRTKSSLYYTSSFGKKNKYFCLRRAEKRQRKNIKTKLRLQYSKEPALTHKIKILYESKGYEDIKASTLEISIQTQPTLYLK